MKQILENWNSYLRDERWGYRLLSETSFSRIVTDYGERGYIIITSDRSCEAERNLPPGKQCSEEEIAEQSEVNNSNMSELQSEIRASGYGYIPTHGGYKEDLIDPETGAASKVDTESPENSLVVVARPDTGRDHESLKEFGMSLAGRYNQDSFFYKPPNEIDTSAYYIKADGSVDMTFSDFTINDLQQQFYTQMARGPKHRFAAIPENKDILFRVRTAPTSTFEAKRRYGEIFMKFKEE